MCSINDDLHLLRLLLADTRLNVHLSDTEEVDEDGVALRGREKWRKNKILGSLLCSSFDITACCIKGNIAFKS